MGTTLILGGARSGKSARAQSLAETCARARLFVATAEARDAEMAARIAHHRAARDATWRTLEAPFDLAACIRAQARADQSIVVDCLTLWLSNLFEAGRDVDAETLLLAQALADLPGDVFLVSNEIGLGLVPDTALGRAFRDAQGRLNQRMAAAADVVEFVAAGLPLRLKG
jgi:adenosylcobinamide kinase/adenosylcobinamide-phosphate guanylyltransferase